MLLTQILINAIGYTPSQQILCVFFFPLREFISMNGKIFITRIFMLLFVFAYFTQSLHTQLQLKLRKRIEDLCKKGLVGKEEVEGKKFHLTRGCFSILFLLLLVFSTLPKFHPKKKTWRRIFHQLIMETNKTCFWEMKTEVAIKKLFMVFIFLPKRTFLQHFYALNAYLCGA